MKETQKPAIKNKFNFVKPEEKEYKDIEEDFDFIRDEKGILKIEKVGEHSINEIIQSHADECGIDNMLKRLKIGQPIQTQQGFYADISELPTDTLNTKKIEKALAEAEAKLKELQEATAKAEALAKADEQGEIIK